MPDDKIIDFAAERERLASELGVSKVKVASQDDLAALFEVTFGERLKYDRHAGQWMEFDGLVWRGDRSHVAANHIRELARQTAEGKKSMLSSGFMDGARRMAENALSVGREEWDSNPMLLNTPGGIVDLRTGATREGSAADLMTKITACAAEDGPPERWLKFMHETTLGDEELKSYLQRACGYMATGCVSEHALFFIFGAGGNGKSVFVNVIRHILGDYSVVADMDAFTEQKYSGHSTAIAMLAGARAVFASETEEGKAWAESRIKRLTGGDPITARFMRQDNFTFPPQFKICIVGNHAPVLKTVDEAMTRRFNIIPFTNKPSEPDKQLEENIIANEAGKVLSWMIDGCLNWQSGGLNRPERVAAATEEYLTGQDLLAEWMDETLRVERENSHLFAPTNLLFKSWASFTAARGEECGKEKSLAMRLSTLGFRPDRVFLNGKKSRGFRGMEVKEPKRWYDDE